MDEKIPDFRAVGLSEAIAKADEWLGGTRLASWVTIQNAARAQAQIDFEAATVEWRGVTLVPGESVVTITVDPRHRTKRRHLNCLFVRQEVFRQDRYEPAIRLRFHVYGGTKGNLFFKSEVFNRESVTVIEVVDPVPPQIPAREAEVKARGW